MALATVGFAQVDITQIDTVQYVDQVYNPIDYNDDVYEYDYRRPAPRRDDIRGGYVPRPVLGVMPLINKVRDGYIIEPSDLRYARTHKGTRSGGYMMPDYADRLYNNDNGTPRHHVKEANNAIINAYISKIEMIMMGRGPRR